MATRTTHQQANVGTGRGGASGAAPEADGQRMVPRLTSEQVWRALAQASFAVLGYVTPSGEPRSSGVVYKTVGRRLYTAVAPDSWKAKHVAASGRVAVTVPVRRGGILSLVAAIPPATITFHGTAIVHQAGSPETHALLKELGSLIPAERRATGWVIEIVPDGQFLTYALGVPLRKMLDPEAALARVPVSQEEGHGGSVPHEPGDRALGTRGQGIDELDRIPATRWAPRPIGSSYPKGDGDA